MAFTDSFDPASIGRAASDLPASLRAQLDKLREAESQPVPGIAHGSIPGLLGIMSGRTGPSDHPLSSVMDPGSDNVRMRAPSGLPLAPEAAAPNLDLARQGPAPSDSGAQPPGPMPPLPTAPPLGPTPGANAGSAAPPPLPSQAMPQAAPQAAPTQPAAGPGAPERDNSFIPKDSLIGRMLNSANNWRDQNRLTLLAMAGGLAGAPSIGTGLSRAFSAAVPAQQADIKQNQQNATARFLMGKMPGMTYEQAVGIASNPTVMAQVLPGIVGAKQSKFTTVSHDKYGQPVMGWVDEVNKKAYDVTGHEITSGTPGAATATGPVNENLHGPDYLATQSPNDANLIRAIAEGREAFPSGAALRTPRGQWLQDAVTQFEPGFNGQVWQQRQKAFNDWYGGGKSQQIVKRIDQATTHAQSLTDSVDKLGNWQIPAANAVGNTISSAVGNPASGPLRTNAHALADELAGIWKGGNLSDAEIKAWSEAFPVNGSIPQQKAAVGKLIELMEGGLNALEDQRRTSFGAHADRLPPVVSQETRAKIEGLKNWANGTATAAGPATGAAAPTFKPPANWQFSPSRQMYRDPAGKMYDANGNPVP
jgi:hypothetical protein